MKTGFKKSLAALMAMLMVFSIMSITASAATTYSVSYKPGTYAKETAEYVQDGIERNETITLRGETYTRTGYTQTGWSTNKNGTSRTYTLEKAQKITKNLTLYPYWTVNKYTITFDAGEYGVGTAQTREVNFGKDVASPGAIFTREGYIQVGWTATVMEITTGADGNEVLTPVVDTIAVGDKIATVTGAVTYVPVWEQVIIDADVEISGNNFGSVCESYVTPNAETITITNNGNVTLNYTLPASEAYNVSVVSGRLALAPGATLVLSVQPKAGLLPADYTSDVVIACDYAECTVSAQFIFVVANHSFDKYVSNGDATYDEDGTKTAKCSNGCGATDTIADEGSMKIFSADNNTAEGLLPAYLYHKTVRFTAFGSGMDNENPVEGSKRFLPVSWYVNDTFNGEFTELTGYDVNYVHTDFGAFTLTINYIEQEMNADGEWVDTGVTDSKTFDYSIGASEKDEQEVIRPNTITNIIFGLFAYLFEIISGLFGG